MNMDWKYLIGLVLVAVILVAVPPFIGYGLWMLLSPIGFWQTLAMLIIEIFFVGFLYTVEITIIAVMAG